MAITADLLLARGASTDGTTYQLGKFLLRQNTEHYPAWEVEFNGECQLAYGVSALLHAVYSFGYNAGETHFRTEFRRLLDL
jgi:hypothetical protein